jgi:hypothetical protein
MAAAFLGSSDEDDLFENIHDYLDGQKKQFKEERENSEKIIKELTEWVEMLEVENAKLRKSCNSAVRPMDMEDSEEEIDTSDPGGRIVFFKKIGRRNPQKLMVGFYSFFLIFEPLSFAI